MKQDECVESFKQMLGEAIFLGTQLSHHAYDGVLQDQENQPLKEGIERLRQITQQFLKSSSLSGITEEQIFPLYEEIQQLAKK